MLTVNAYNDDEEIANKQTRIFREDLKRELIEENPDLDHPAMMKGLEDMMRELFGGLAPSIGSWPASSAYYAVDVIFDANESSRSPQGSFIPQAKLLEVNFMGGGIQVLSSRHF